VPPAVEETEWIDVSWQEPGPDGCAQTNKIRMKVRIVPAREGAPDGAAAFIKRVSLDWDEVLGPDGEPVSFAADRLALLVDAQPNFAWSFVASYLAARGRRRIAEVDAAVARAKPGTAIATFLHTIAEAVHD
jgi:hypothetical protein